MPDGGTVTIETENIRVDEPHAIEHFDAPAGPYVLLVVQDSGTGMDPATREHIFEPFFTTKALGRGTGLGLATAYGIVRQAGGHIGVQSEPGRGTTFKLYFPRIADQIVSDPPMIEADPAVGAGVVLLVEDEPLVRAMTTQVLTRSGLDVIAVASGADAMSQIAQLDPPIDVLIADVLMPGMSGVELAELVMDAHPEVVIVLISGYMAETLNLERVTSRGATFLAKPVTSRQLLAAVQQARSLRLAHRPSRD
jgi:CheY-like chemotaxis protein